jgi:hypothetical protein
MESKQNRHMAQRNGKRGERREKQMHGTQRLRTFYEAAERTGVSYWTLWRGAEAGFFKTVYLGSRRMIPEEELERIIEYGFGGRKRRTHQESAEPAEARA